MEYDSACGTLFDAGEVETSESEKLGIGARVIAARERLGWTREALAFHSGISWSGIAQIESGRRRNLRPDTLSALAGALGVTIDYLVAGGPANTPMLDHTALLYGAADELVDTAGPFLEDGIERSEAVLVMARKENIRRLRAQLGPAARRVEFVDSTGWYKTPTTALNGLKAFCSAKLEGGAPWIRILGDPIWAGPDAEARLWTRYESLVNLVFAAWPMTVLCAYDERSVHPEIVKQACLTHPQTIGREGPADSTHYPGPGGLILEPDP
jgi:transcriptional regulator with XRE-family HTH domain